MTRFHRTNDDRRRGSVEQRISDAEWQVMRVLWDRREVTTPEIIEALEETGWKPSTIKTLVRRLVDKGIAAYHVRYSRHSYYPVVSETECMGAARNAFVDKVYRGRLFPTVAGFLSDGKLTSSEIAELKRLLREQETTMDPPETSPSDGS
jgi:BlaI family penicillinase repressor